ncbi:hypothetical protein N7E02_09620 [Aliirhizobium terrae]|uniref:hypothetical protein n=1 Tax=Terrirhizobium terrae TaxID=2926709 RepID=UPI002577A279|nr:hypothetical protein [Rhizobium sp. CC-CFT758]WJH40812.1 hypothetical protein N7E02_09620 [Rhizobium sp. CC-CFT758]
MAQYKYPTHLVAVKSWAFDQEWKPGQIVKNAGIYRCRTCGDEIVVDKGAAIPQHHHEHTLLGPVVWQMLVFAQKHPGR